MFSSFLSLFLVQQQNSRKEKENGRSYVPKRADRRAHSTIIKTSKKHLKCRYRPSSTSTSASVHSKQRRPTNRATFTVELVWPLKKKLVAVATDKKTSFFKQNWQRCSSVPIHQGIFEPRDPVTSSERVTSESALVKGKKTEQKTAGTRLVSREPIVSVFFSQCEPKQQFHPRLPHIRWPTKLGKTR